MGFPPLPQMHSTYEPTPEERSFIETVLRSNWSHGLKWEYGHPGRHDRFYDYDFTSDMRPRKTDTGLLVRSLDAGRRYGYRVRDWSVFLEFALSKGFAYDPPKPPAPERVRTGGIYEYDEQLGW